RLDPEAMKDAGELDCDITAADDADALRQTVEMKSLVGGDRQLMSGQMTGNERCRTGGDQQILRGDLAAIDKAYGMTILDDGTAHDEVGARRFEIADVGLVEPIDLLVLVGDEARPIEGDLFARPAEADGILEILGEFRGVDEELLWHAAADDTG